MASEFKKSTHTKPSNPRAKNSERRPLAAVAVLFSGTTFWPYGKMLSRTNAQENHNAIWEDIRPFRPSTTNSGSIFSTDEQFSTDVRLDFV